MAKSVSFSLDSAEFKAAVGTLKAMAKSEAARKKAAGQCSALAIRAQAEVATLYAVSAAWDKEHNPQADVYASAIRQGLADAGVNENTIDRVAKDALAICRHPEVKGITAADAFLREFEARSLKTASAVRAWATGKVADPVAQLAARVRKLAPEDRARFDALLAAAE